MNIKNQLSTAVAGGLQRGSGLRRTLCLLALVAFYAVGAKADVAINATNFPDANFRNWVLAQDYGADGKLIDSEIAAVRSIDVHSKSIADLKGIEYFTALRVLGCYSNQLTSLDVSKNTELRTLSCYSNQLTSLDVSGCTALTTLNCDNNQLTSLDVSKNTALKRLACYYNQLKSLDVSKNAALTSLFCYNNQIRGAGMATLVNSLLTVWGGNFYVYNTDGTEGNEITTVQVKAAKAKGWDVWTSDEDDYPGVPGIAIDATNFPDEIFRAYVRSNCDTDKDTYLSDNEIAAVTRIDVSRKSITNLKGIEYFTALTILNCINNQLTSLDVSNNTALEDLYCAGNQLTSLDVSENKALTYLTCGDNKLTSLDVSKNTALTYLSCHGNQLTSLDVSKNTALTKLYCYVNQLTSLDVSKNTALTSLSCGHNPLTSLDVSKNTALTNLDCQNNQLTTLDVSGCTELEELWCYNNQLISLDVSKNTALTELYCYGNQIRGVGMATLIETLPTVTYGDFYVTDEFDGNRITTVQVAAAKAKHWNVKTSYALDYPGVDPGIAIDATNFPDEKFRAYVSSECDTDKDTYLSDDEIAAVKYIVVSRESIASLKGIEYFTALTWLICDSNQLTSLDVSKNTALSELSCWGNQLTSLDVSKNTELGRLSCGSNQLKSLDVSKNTLLTELSCWGNQLTSLDVSKNKWLTFLMCYENQIRGAGMATLVNSLPEVTNGTFCVYYIDGTDGNRITTVQVAAAKAKGWDVLAVREDHSYYDYPGVDLGIAIDATNFPDENFRTYVSSNCDTDKDTYLSDNEIAAVTDINVWRKSISDLKGIEYFTALTVLWCHNNQLTSLDVSKNTALEELFCGDNKLTSLDVSKNTALTELQCYNNPLTSLDLSKNTALKELFCVNNQLTSLDVSKNTALTDLLCYNNQIRGAGMATLINSLPEVTNGIFEVYDSEGTEGNEITTVQVKAAKAKGWDVLTGVGDDYPGVDIPGDANGDGEVNAQDVDCLRDYILGLDPTPFSLESANLNGDGAVDIVDLTLLIEMLKD